LQVARLDLVAQLETALALLGEERVAEDDVRPPNLVAQPLDLVDDVGNRAGAVAGENAVRAIRAELGAAAAREQRVAAADRPRGPLDPELLPAMLADQIPAGKWERVEVVDLLADGVARRDLSRLRHPHDARFRLA